MLVLLATILVVVGCWTAFGRRAHDGRRARMEHSPQWRDGRFRNPQPLVNHVWGALSAAFHASPDAVPSYEVPTVPGDRTRFATPPASGLRVTWLGHSSLLVEIDGRRVLTDPIWSERASPLQWVGPRRWYAPPIPLDELPALDAIIISHDHYDHLDAATVTAMKSWNVRFIVPLGVGAHLAYWGVPERRIIELDWWEHVHVGDLDIVCTPARHASGRMPTDMDGTLWAGYALVGARHRVFFSGDTGLFPALAEIGASLGPFDLTMIEAGQYNRAWPDWHMGPEQAVRAHAMVRGRVLLPIHWGLFQLAFHGWTEPIERVLAAAKQTGATVIAPQPGQSIEPEAQPTLERWWPALPWHTAAEDPIVSTQTGRPH